MGGPGARVHLKDCGELGWAVVGVQITAQHCNPWGLFAESKYPSERFPATDVKRHIASGISQAKVPTGRIPNEGSQATAPKQIGLAQVNDRKRLIPPPPNQLILIQEFSWITLW